MRKGWSLVPLLLLLLVVGGGAGWAESRDVPRMSVEELRAKLGTPQVVILDVRSGRDWKSSEKKIVGAVREEPADLGWASKYDRSQTLVLYCA